MSLCSIIVVTHNQLPYTKQCLESIAENTVYHPFELVVVDAHSTDDTLEYLRSKPEVKIVCLEKNYPVSYSLNRGIEVAKGEYLCLMNNDTLVQPGWLEALIQCAKSNEKIGIVGPKLCNQDMSANSTGRLILPDGYQMYLWPPDNTVTPCTYVVGACFLIKRELIDNIGLLDESFFFAFDETDYCMRTWKAGWKVVCYTSSKVVHFESVTLKTVTDKDYEYDIRGYENPKERFYKRYSPKDFEMVLKEIKGQGRFYLWKIRFKAYKFLHRLPAKRWR